MKTWCRLSASTLMIVCLEWTGNAGACSGEKCGLWEGEGDPWVQRGSGRRGMGRRRRPGAGDYRITNELVVLVDGKLE